MANTDYATESTNPAPEFLAEVKTQAETLLNQVGETFANLRDVSRQFASLVMDVRQSYVTRQVTVGGKKKTRVWVRDLDGRSKSYRAWLDEVLTPMVENVISDPNDRRLFNQNLRSYIQNERVSRCKADKDLAREAKLLGLSMSTQAQRVKKSRDGKPSDTKPDTDAIIDAENLNQASIRDAAQAMVTATLSLLEKVENTDKLNKGDRDAIDSHIETMVKTLAKIRGAVHPSGVRVEETKPVAA